MLEMLHFIHYPSKFAVSNGHQQTESHTGQVENSLCYYKADREEEIRSRQEWKNSKGER